MTTFRTSLLRVACRLGSALPAQQPASCLVGTWRVVEFCDVDRPGDTLYTLGRSPIGFFSYDRAGNRSIQAMRATPVAAFMKHSVPLAGMAEARNSYFGYFGTDTVTSDATVVHHITGGTIPSYTGTDPQRTYRLRGDTLSISGRDRWTCRTLVRVC